MAFMCTSDCWWHCMGDGDLVIQNITMALIGIGLVFLSGVFVVAHVVIARSKNKNKEQNKNKKAD